MLVYLPIAEMAVNAPHIALLGAVVGVISGVFGIGGGFLTTPFLIFMGIPPAIAVGTQSSQLIASSSTSVISHWKKRNIDFKMAGIMLVGGLIGTISGIFIFKLLQYFGKVDVIISVLYVIFLCGIGGMMLSESITTIIQTRRRNLSDTNNDENTAQPQISKWEEWRRNLPYKMSFPTSKLHISALLPLGVGVIGGLMVSVMGIGAGFLLVPAMIYFLRVPPLLVAGTSLAQIMVTSAFACILHAVTNQTVDLILALLLISGSVIGAQIGVRLSQFIKGSSARLLLSLIILMVGLKLAGGLFIPPDNLYSIISD